MSTTSRTVSFRIGPDHYQRLENSAAAANQSAGDFARLRLLENLDGDGGLSELITRLTRLENFLGDGVAETKTRLTHLEGLVAEFRHDLPLTAQALLTAVGSRESISPETAEKWVRDNLKTQD